MSTVACPICGNRVEKTIAGSLTQFVLGKPLCSCENTSAKFAKAKRDISYCYRCSKKISNESTSSLTAFLENRDFCRCRRTVMVKKTGAFASTTQVSAHAAVIEDAISKANLQQELDSARTLAGTYRLVDRLGEGGMSYVFLAEHTRLRKMVALKVMKADIALKNKEEMFRTEAKRLVSLNHPCLTAVFDFALHKDQWPVIAMELVSGETLADVLLRLGPLPLEEALLVFKQVAEGLSYIHLKGLVHKDLKPGNIMLAKLNIDGEDTGKTAVKILDFGISQFSSYGDNNGPVASHLIVGSPSYMSPEEWMGQEITPRTDLYAFACSLYEVLTGTVPYQADTIEEIKEQHLTAMYPGLTENKVNQVYPNELDLLLKKLMSKRPEDRSRSAHEVYIALDAIIAKLDKSGSSDFSQRFRQESLTTGASTAATSTVALIAIVSFVLAGAVAAFFWLNSQAKTSKKINESSSAAILSGKPNVNVEPFLQQDPETTVLPGSTVTTVLFPAQRSVGALLSKSGKRYDLQGTVRILLEPKSGFSYLPSAAAVANPGLIDLLEPIPVIAVRVASDDSEKQISLTAAFIEKLTSNKRLQQLDLWSVSITKPALVALSAIRGLNKLSITECTFSDDIRSSWGRDLAQGQCLNNLEHLNLHYLQPADPVIETLAKVKEFQGLCLVDSPLSAASFAKIVEMKNLKNLELNNCAVTPAVALTFLSLPALQKLALGPECVINSQFLDRALEKRNFVNLFVGPIDTKVSAAKLREYKDSFNAKQIFFRCEAVPVKP